MDSLRPHVRCRWLAELRRDARRDGPFRFLFLPFGGFARRTRRRLSCMASVPFLEAFTSTSLRDRDGAVLRRGWCRRSCFDDAPPNCASACWWDYFDDTMSWRPNQITAANAGKRLGFAGKSRVGLSPRPGVAEFHR